MRPPADPAPAPRYRHDGLAVYVLGHGEPLLVMPNPQGMVREPQAHEPLVRLLAGLPRRVVTFDPPGAFASARQPRLGLAEMVRCALEALAVAGVRAPVDVVGHSQATLCALALALEAPATVRRLVLIGAVDGGWRATRRARGMPWCWPVTDRRFWRFAWLAAPLALGRSNLRRLKRLQRLFVGASFVDPRLAPAIDIEPADAHRPAPRRARWQASVRDVDLRPRLAEVTAPALVCVGRADPQTPPRDNAAIAARLPDCRVVVFDRSGHYPYVEEPDRFRDVVGRFLATAVDPDASRSPQRRARSSSPSTSGPGVPTT
jgi:pimeloyl-ACP methyl ester carboxylesterase